MKKDDCSCEREFCGGNCFDWVNFFIDGIIMSLDFRKLCEAVKVWKAWFYVTMSDVCKGSEIVIYEEFR